MDFNKFFMDNKYVIIAIVVFLIFGSMIGGALFYWFVLRRSTMVTKIQTSSGKTISLENFSDNTGKTMALFYAPWCGHCKRAMPIWDQFAADIKGITTTKINCDEQPEVAAKHEIKGFPVIRLYPNGLDDLKNYIEYTGDRTYDGFISFVNQYAKTTV